MESKHDWVDLIPNESDLLIEPVWNRNELAKIAVQDAIKTLLIEPVWNRNVAFTVIAHPNAELLIEPVWNRNPIVPTSR